MAEETMQYDGITWYRDVESDNGWYSYWHKKNGDMLHRYIYEKYYGPIPEGYIVHHADFNKYNNNPENLICMTNSQHLALHNKHRMEDESKYQTQVKHLDKIRSKGIEWHHTEEGHEWHKEHGKNLKNVTLRDFTCIRCGKQYQTTNIGRNKYCSRYCASKATFESGKHHEPRICENCGNTFMAYKYAKTKCCTVSCAQSLRRMRNTKK